MGPTEIVFIFLARGGGGSLPPRHPASYGYNCGTGTRGQWVWEKELPAQARGASSWLCQHRTERYHDM